MIASLTWYAHQGQNNPFRSMRILTVTTINNLTSLTTYNKKGDEVTHQLMLPLLAQDNANTTVSENLKNYILVNNLNNTKIINSFQSQVKEFIDLNKTEELRRKQTERNGISFSDPFEIAGLFFRGIYTKASDSPLALSVAAEDITIIIVKDPISFISDPSSIELKEKFMVAIISKCNEENTTTIRNLLRPEYLIHVTDGDSSKTVENIIYLNKDNNLKITKDIKGMIKLKDLSN